MTNKEILTLQAKVDNFENAWLSLRSLNELLIGNSKGVDQEALIYLDEQIDDLYKFFLSAARTIESLKQNQEQEK